MSCTKRETEKAMGKRNAVNRKEIHKKPSKRNSGEKTLKDEIQLKTKQLERKDNFD